MSGQKKRLVVLIVVVILAGLAVLTQQYVWPSLRWRLVTRRDLIEQFYASDLPDIELLSADVPKDFIHSATVNSTWIYSPFKLELHDDRVTHGEFRLIVTDSIITDADAHHELQLYLDMFSLTEEKIRTAKIDSEREYMATLINGMGIVGATQPEKAVICESNASSVFWFGNNKVISGFVFTDDRSTTKVFYLRVGDLKQATAEAIASSLTIDGP